ncbi:MAG TPA: acetyl-CoA carboxylase carboxyltransferase subunit alpha [Candidatus Omnitrophota bacterium]|jgi:acetyl-CoA carboxylase carboxyl transferase subunit alpha|nr:MAG: Acetyl-coenzyme A carboxylase carboxyl transferase subunit alpha [Candidatus Omnitrophica bacterium ADurb.Bin314]HOE68892.1 acetyl-CoA carboxylase carboxyltransferase subunit alpha [Candidatus Omnitrophota bacterium]HQB94769.1 acetyl-CoA carboxylase carboxyltransferase subunit alpha [Candidatus Omnitrophota bacterium]
MAKKNKKAKIAVEEVSLPKEKIQLGTKNIFDACLPFEKPVVEMEKKINELRKISQDGVDLSDEIKSAEKKLKEAIQEIFDKLTPWQRVQVARHPLRPYTLDYINYLTRDFIELHGDRRYSDDRAIVAGLAKWDGKEPVCVIGHQKGRDTKENLMRSFGSAHPEGYRKAMRVMRLAERHQLPIICFIDTPGAYPGIGAEERGQAEAIAYNLREMGDLQVPVICIVIGEGGSGGALGIGVGDRVYVLANAYYSVISPEGCAAILWKEPTRAPDAATALKLTGQDLLELGVIDGVIPEPLGGAHRDFVRTADNILQTVNAALAELKEIPKKDLPELRYQKYREMGVFASK